MKPEDIQDLKQLIEFLKENQVAEFDLDRGDLKIRLKFNPAVVPVAVARAGNMPVGAVLAAVAVRGFAGDLSLFRKPNPMPDCTL